MNREELNMRGFSIDAFIATKERGDTAFVADILQNGIRVAVAEGLVDRYPVRFLFSDRAAKDDFADLAKELNIDPVHTEAALFEYLRRRVILEDVFHNAEATVTLKMAIQTHPLLAKWRMNIYAGSEPRATDRLYIETLDGIDFNFYKIIS